MLILVLFIMSLTVYIVIYVMCEAYSNDTNDNDDEGMKIADIGGILVVLAMITLCFICVYF